MKFEGGETVTTYTLTRPREFYADLPAPHTVEAVRIALRGHAVDTEPHDKQSVKITVSGGMPSVAWCRFHSVLNTFQVRLREVQPAPV